MGVLGLVLVLLLSTLYPINFAIILMWKRELVALLELSSWYLLSVCFLWIFSWCCGLVCSVLVALPDYTLLYFIACCWCSNTSHWHVTPVLFVNIYITHLYSLVIYLLVEHVQVLLMINKYTMHNKFSNCFIWVSPSTSDLRFHLLS